MSIKFYLLLIFLFVPKIKSFFIMLDPTGDAKNTGRIIDNYFERALAFQFAEELKKNLDKNGAKTIISRNPGEILEPLQNASFANRLKIDLFLNINFYKEKEKPRIFIYYLIYNPKTDLWKKEIKDLSFMPADHAYLFNVQKTKKICENFKNNLSKHFNTTLLGIPFKSLIGIKPPAMAIEIGLDSAENWKNFIQPICEGLKSIYEN